MKWIAYGVASISIASAIWIFVSATKLGLSEIARAGMFAPQAGLYEQQDGNRKRSSAKQAGAKSQLQQKRRVTKHDSVE